MWETLHGSIDQGKPGSAPRGPCARLARLVVQVFTMWGREQRLMERPARVADPLRRHSSVFRRFGTGHALVFRRAAHPHCPCLRAGAWPGAAAAGHGDLGRP